MAKINPSNDLNRPRGTSALLAIGLAASLAAFGCTTNMNPGAGTPTRITPEIRTSPTSGEPIGTENVQPLPPPMTSSYNEQSVLPTTNAGARRSIHHTAAEAAAIMAGAQPPRGRYLGVSNPGSIARGYSSDRVAMAQLARPPYSVNEQTVNSSIVSPPTGVVNSGAGGVDTTNAAIITSSPTTTAAATLPATTSLGVVTPTATTSIANNPTVTAASSGAPTIASTSTTTPAVTTVSNASVTTTNASSTPVRIVRSSTGSPTVTNTGSARNQ